MTKPRLLFIHRSVGQNLITDGDMYGLVESNNSPFILNDFNQNTSTLQDTSTSMRTVPWTFPGGDTTPGDYAQLFSKQRSSDPMLSEILSYDIIAIKSCFPNTRITSNKMLAEHQRSYEQIITFFHGQAGKKLAILTSPPLIPTLTLPAFARRARSLAKWLSATDFSPNVCVFDFFNELAAPEGKPQANTLRKEYRRRFPFDSHPNAAAAEAIVPKVVDFFAHVGRT